MTKRMAVAAMAFAGIFLATYLTLYKLGIIGQLACTVGECETVNLSRWARFFGLPVAAWGVGYYVVLFAVAMAGVSDRYGDVPWIATALLVLTGWGVVFSAWLTYLELFVIRAICLYCVVSAVLVTIAFVVSLMDWRERRALAMEV